MGSSITNTLSAAFEGEGQQASKLVAKNFNKFTVLLLFGGFFGL